ncbi:MAG: hypothetical protein AB7O26_17155 [Planctomycetaceae bacterium]
MTPVLQLRFFALGAFAFALLLAYCAVAEEPLKPVFGQTRMVVLRSGRVVEGKVSRNSAGYVVDLPTGGISISEKQVKFVADDRADACRKMAEFVDTSTADGHLQLADWCMKNTFYDEAANELRAALSIDPARGDARRMLTRLEDLRNPKNPIHRTQERTVGRTTDGFEAGEIKSLGGLSRNNAVTYMSKVQPILMNRCAMTSCHGPQEKNDFRLERVSVGQNTHRLVSDRNLAQVLKYIDSDNASKSRLLTVPSGPHGKNNLPVFSGVLAAEQLKTLETWVNSVSRETGKRQRDDDSRPKLDDVQPPGTIAEADSRMNLIQQTSGTLPSNKENNGKPDLLEKVLREERPDPFDPAEFNRRFHSGMRHRTSD